MTQEIRIFLCPKRQFRFPIRNPRSAIRNGSLPLVLRSRTHLAPINLAPINLAHHTNAYTVLRAEEYVAHRRSISGWMDTRRDPPEYISQLRECPCGSALPCPHHAPFPDYFWKLSPFSLSPRDWPSDKRNATCTTHRSVPAPSIYFAGLSFKSDVSSKLRNSVSSNACFVLVGRSGPSRHPSASRNWLFYRKAGR